MNNVRTDCFAYNETQNDCNAFTELFCKNKECKFYKGMGWKKAIRREIKDYSKSRRSK